VKVKLAGVVVVGVLLAGTVPLRAQADEGVMSDAEVESLRDAAYVPMDRIAAYVKILDTREKRLDGLVSKRRYPGRADELHDLMSQMAGIADELSDNLEELDKQHRDVRKALPKVVSATERWSTALRAPADDVAYNVERKLALDALKDMRELAEGMETEEEAYFKEHPEAEKAEKERVAHPHATSAGEAPN